MGSSESVLVLIGGVLLAAFGVLARNARWWEGFARLTARLGRLRAGDDEVAHVFRLVAVGVSVIGVLWIVAALVSIVSQ